MLMCAGSCDYKVTVVRKTQVVDYGKDESYCASLKTRVDGFTEQTLLHRATRTVTSNKSSEDKHPIGFKVAFFICSKLISNSLSHCVFDKLVVRGND